MRFGNSKTHRLVLIALMAAASIILAKTTRFPLFPAAPFLKMELGEIPLLLAAVIIPPWGGMAALLAKECLSFLVFGTNLFGLAADFLSCGAFLLMFSLLLRSHPTPRRAAAAVLAGAVTRMAASVPINLVILQLQYGSAVETILAQMPYIFLFNGLKCGLDGLCVVPLLARLRLRPMESPAQK